MNPKDLTLSQLLSVPEQKLVQIDIARMNLLCAAGLNGSEDLDIIKYGTGSVRDDIGGLKIPLYLNALDKLPPPPLRTTMAPLRTTLATQIHQKTALTALKTKKTPNSPA